MTIIQLHRIINMVPVLSHLWSWPLQRLSQIFSSFSYLRHIYHITVSAFFKNWFWPCFNYQRVFFLICVQIWCINYLLKCYSLKVGLFPQFLVQNCFWIASTSFFIWNKLISCVFWTITYARLNILFYNWLFLGLNQLSWWLSETMGFNRIKSSILNNWRFWLATQAFRNFENAKFVLLKILRALNIRLICIILKCQVFLARNYLLLRRWHIFWTHMLKLLLRIVIFQAVLWFNYLHHFIEVCKIFLEIVD